MRHAFARLGLGSLVLALLSAVNGCGAAGGGGGGGPSAGVVRTEQDPQLTRVVLVNADGTSTDLGERWMSAEALSVTEGSPVVGFRVDGDGRLVGVQLQCPGTVPGIDLTPGEHACRAIVTDRHGRVVRVEHFRAGEVPPVCNPVYTIVNNVLTVTCKALDCPAPSARTLHKEVVEHETRYWCTCDAAP